MCVSERAATKTGQRNERADAKTNKREREREREREKRINDSNSKRGYARKRTSCPEDVCKDMFGGRQTNKPVKNQKESELRERGREGERERDRTNAPSSMTNTLYTRWPAENVSAYAHTHTFTFHIHFSRCCYDYWFVACF